MQSFGRLTVEVGAWARENFGDQPALNPGIGAIEELGELAHAVLKTRQGIRTDEDHEAAVRDAVGDLVIYLADHEYRSLQEDRDGGPGTDHDADRLCAILGSLFALLTQRGPVNRSRNRAGILLYLRGLCDSRGWDLEEVVEETWAKVRQRNWKKDPVKGGE